METNSNHPDQKYIDGLANNNTDIIQWIYKKYVPKVVSYIKSNSGSTDEAKDIVQEVLIVLFNQAKAKQLQLRCPFDAYFFLLCKRKWLNEIKKQANKGVTIDEAHVSTYEQDNEMLAQTELFESKQALFDAMFLKLGDKCKELLQLSFTIKSLEEVAEKLHVSYGYVRKKKSLCTGQLTQWIQEHQRFASIKNK